MSDEKYDYAELAKKFANKSISSKQLKALKQRVKIDENLADEVAFQVALKKTFDKTQNREQEIAKEVKGILNKTKVVTPIWRSINSKKIILAAAASILLLLSLWFVVGNYLDNQERTNIAAYELEEMVKNANPKNNLSSTDDLEELLEKRDFSAAIELALEKRAEFKDLCKNDVANYYLGKLYLYYESTQDLTQSIQALTCIQENYSDLYPRVSIHLARAYLWSGNESKAQQFIKNSTTDLPEDLKKLMD